jgi:hypothetical protein
MAPVPRTARHLRLYLNNSFDIDVSVRGPRAADEHEADDLTLTATDDYLGLLELPLMPGFSVSY